jgi:hypothetical protein
VPETTDNKHVTPLSAWPTTSYERPVWVREKHGKTIAEPNAQKSNNEFSNDQVLQPRAEKVGKSNAFPLNGGSPDRPTGGIAPTSGII